MRICIEGTTAWPQAQYKSNTSVTPTVYTKPTSGSRAGSQKKQTPATENHTSPAKEMHPHRSKEALLSTPNQREKLEERRNNLRKNSKKYTEHGIGAICSKTPPEYKPGNNGGATRIKPNTLCQKRRRWAEITSEHEIQQNGDSKARSQQEIQRNGDSKTKSRMDAVRRRWAETTSEHEIQWNGDSKTRSRMDAVDEGETTRSRCGFPASEGSEEQQCCEGLAKEGN